MASALQSLLALFYENLLVSRIVLAVFVFLVLFMFFGPIISKGIRSPKTSIAFGRVYLVASTLFGILTYFYGPDAILFALGGIEWPSEATPGKGWGPERSMFTMEVPPSYVTFNSITDNNLEIGDERYFCAASLYTGNATNNRFSDKNVVAEGEEYVVRIYVDNNAADNLGLIATDVRAYIIMQENAEYSYIIAAKLFSNNANPDTVWDATSFYSDRKFVMAYVPGTLKYYNTANLAGFVLDPDGTSLYAFQKEGIPLGYEEMDGRLPSGNAYSGYLTFHVVPVFK